jgi:hypothetical protein
MDLGFRGVSDHQSLQNVIVIILYHVQFLRDMSTFNESNINSLLKHMISLLLIE